MKAHLSLIDVDAIKAQLLRLLPDVKSSHRVEALARGLGYGTNAALRADLSNGPQEREVIDDAFAAYLAEHGFSDVREDILKDAIECSRYSVELSAIAAVLSKEPDLFPNGYRTPNDKDEDVARSRASMLSSGYAGEFSRACEYLNQVGRRARVNKDATSYGWKHQVERFHKEQHDRNTYVSNGMFIVAAIHLGFIVKRISGSPNAYLNIGFADDGKRRRSSGLATHTGGKIRLAAWRNMMVAAINAGLDQGAFGLAPDDNRWSGENGLVYRFDFGDMPAIASVHDAGWGELSIHVAVKPTEDGEKAIKSSNAGLYAGDAFAAGWLERKDGKWLQTSDKPSNAFRRNLLPVIAAVKVEPKGFKASGPIKL